MSDEEFFALWVSIEQRHGLDGSSTEAANVEFRALVKRFRQKAVDAERKRCAKPARKVVGESGNIATNERAR